ncbi:MAG: cobalamin-dependent protein [Candidatus Riflebacteria bacterium]|nr:cobalamin-dependent protein [Candidatus Riflebacteria bacterium]
MLIPKQKSSIDILFVAPPLLWGQESHLDIKPPLNLLYLANWLNHCGFHSQVLDVNSTGFSLQEVIETVEKMQPSFIGVPFYQATRETTFTLCNMVRERFPEIKIIAGGPLVTTFPENILLNDSPVDVCVIGEGELTTEEILRHSKTLKQGIDKPSLSNIPGLAYCENGKLVFSPPRKHIENLDSLPFLDFNLIDIQWYFAFQASVDMSAWLFLTTSRGCNARCSFCATPVLWHGRMRRQSVPRLLAEISHQKALFPQASFGFMDDSFFSDKKWLQEFFTGISQINLRYCCIGRADHLTAEDVRSLAKTGCIYVAFGIETGNQKRQNTLKKFLDLDKVRSSVRLLVEHKIFCKCFFMIGFPDETPEEMVETINFAVELKRLGMGECNFFPVSIYPGTELAGFCSEKTYSSDIYQNVRSAPEKKEDIGETKLFRYANIPKNDVNMYFKTSQILKIVKLAYNKLASCQNVELSELTTGQTLTFC